MKFWYTSLCLIGSVVAIPAYGSDCDASGIFSQPFLLRNPHTTRAIAWADMDLDGKIDSVIAGLNLELKLQSDNPLLPFPSFGQVLDSPGSASDVAVGDLNGDGYPDIVTSHASGAPLGMVSVLLTENMSNEFGQFELYQTNGNPLRMKLADINGDGWLDIMTIHEFENTVSVLMNLKDGTFSSANVIDLGDGQATDLTVGDVDSDGDQDLILADKELGQIHLLKNNGAGELLLAQSVDVGIQTSGVELGDIDGDGHLDLVAVNDDRETFNDIVPLINNGHGEFAVNGSYPMSILLDRGSYRVALGDMNGDGSLDIVTANREEENQFFADEDVSLFFNNGDGSFGEFYSIDTVGIRTLDIELCDLNSDGALDIAATITYIPPSAGTLRRRLPVTWVNPCGAAPCEADLAQDGVLDFFDVSAFLDGFAAQDPVADFTGDGLFDFFDVSAFLDAFSNGCPIW